MPTDEQETLPDEEREYYEQYFLRIEQLFAALRGRSLLLSPADYQLARQWYDRGVPLSCALRGIRAAFFRKLSEGDPDDEILSLSWCRWAVTKEWKEYKSVPTGEEKEEESSAPQRSGDEVLAILESACFDLNRAADRQGNESEFAENLRVLAAEIEAIKERWGSSDLDDGSIEELLSVIDGRLLEIALIHIPAKERAKLEKTVDRKLRPHLVSMDEETRERTRATALAAKVRQHFQLPKITLFSL